MAVEVDVLGIVQELCESRGGRPGHSSGAVGVEVDVLGIVQELWESRWTSWA